nr:hypothetical protein [Nonomuraea ceibae]
MAVIVPRAPSVPPTQAEIEAFSRARLADTKCPRYVRFVAALPSNPGSKTLKTQLREHREHQEGTS